ncbi:MAG: hypothetical protein L6Q54_06960 [Leptospiraceae bacterium]|nr:hypothetical protein [Leptospiraceae bacterium]MCK6380978.1 hypothetical protein [Leptospiraceae bacterium]NUM40999.1 hypothetical protein [Leptospiraceae bacterium]
MIALQTFFIKKSSDFIGENIISGEFQIQKPPDFSFLQTYGNFPRSVQIGETLFFSDYLNILSPISGYAHFSENKKDTLVLTLNGTFEPKEKYSKDAFQLKTLKEKILKYGNTSFDFTDETLITCLNKFSDKENSKIIFSPFSKNEFIDFQEKIHSEFSVELELFKKNIKEVFPKSKVLDFLSRKQKKSHYPSGDPMYFLCKYIGLPNSEKFPLHDVLFLGAETLYYLFRSLYREIPFIERMFSVNFLHKNGKFKTQKKPIFLKNGQNINFITKNFQNRFRYFSTNSIYTLPVFFPSTDNFFLDIYSDTHLNLVAKNPVQKKELPCIDCKDCSLFCPVNLKPRNILDENDKSFQSELCIECGLCTVYCPSGINFRKRISDKKRLRHVGS